MADYERPPYQVVNTEKEQIEVLIQDDFPIVYFSIHSALFVIIGLIELVLIMISKVDFGPVFDIGHSLISAAVLVVLGILSIFLMIYQSYYFLKACFYSYCFGLVTNISGSICLNIVSIASTECFPNESCKLGIHIVMLLLGIVALVGNLAHILILQWRYL